MLFFGYLGETGRIERMIADCMGFIAFFITFGIIPLLSYEGILNNRGSIFEAKSVDSKESYSMILGLLSLVSSPPTVKGLTEWIPI
jgi:hypothetical protein